MYNTNISVCPQTIFNVKSVGEITCNNPNYNIYIYIYIYSVSKVSQLMYFPIESILGVLHFS